MNSRYTSAVIVLLTIVLLVCSGIHAQENNPLPRFEDYPIKIHYQGKTARPIIANKQDGEYRTTLREAAGQKPNFAGKYILTTFGCGGGCVMGAAMDAQTGKVAWIPLTVCCWPVEVENPLEFKLESSLLIVKGSRNEKGQGTYYYNFDGREFHLLRAIETPDVK